MKRKSFFFLALMISVVSCQQSELIDPSELVEATEQLNTESGDVEERTYQETLAQYGILTRQIYFIQNNLWNINAPGASAQKAWVRNIDDWGAQTAHTVGNGAVKSYPGIVFGTHYGNSPPNTFGMPKRVGNLGNMYCRWNQFNNMTKGNASFDIWFHSTPNHGSSEADIEMMIWTQRKGGMNPLAHAYNANGAVPIDTRWFNGKQYKVYRGVNGNGTRVYTFVQTDNSGQFAGQIKPFVNYCKSKGWINNNHYLLSVQAGWEYISGGSSRTTLFRLSGI